MTIGTLDDSQRKAARLVGFAYLLALPPAVFAEFVVRGRLITSGDAALTAQTILAHERFFRLGIASNLTVFALDAVLIVGLYQVLRPVHRSLALVAAAWGLLETATLVAVTFSDFDVLRILGGAASLHAFDAAQVQALARLPLRAHGDVYNVGLVLAGLRSTAFGCLWLRSRYIPRSLAAWGILASLLMGACAFLFIVFPELERTLPVVLWGAPIFLFELTMGLWLLFRGLSVSGAEAAP